jgi:hypothetical protein
VNNGVASPPGGAVGSPASAPSGSPAAAGPFFITEEEDEKEGLSCEDPELK